MKYRVVWTGKAEGQLAEIWLRATDKEAVTAATYLLDHILEEDPLDPRHEIVHGFGTALRVPIGIDFGVDPRRALVIVIGAWFANALE